MIVVFMAVTSSGSAELVAVSSLVSYDVYRTYINPKATGKQVRTYQAEFPPWAIALVRFDT